MRIISDIQKTGWLRRKLLGQNYTLRVRTYSLFLGGDFEDFYFRDYQEAKLFRDEFYRIYG